MMAAMTPDDIRALFDLQYQASRAHIDVPLLVRRERLLRVQKMLDEHGAVLAAAVQADFGMRSPRLTEVAATHTTSQCAWMCSMMAPGTAVSSQKNTMPRWPAGSASVMNG